MPAIGAQQVESGSLASPGDEPVGRCAAGAGHGRGQVDHRLARQHLINEYRRGRLSQDQVCDAHPELIRAARNVGTESSTPCPICDEDALRLVTYVFGPRLPAHGKCVTTAKELRGARPSREELSAYVVEACVACHWHHLRSVLPVGGADA